MLVNMSEQEQGLNIEERLKATRVRNTLKWNEDKMNEGAKAVAKHLKEIHDQKLYRYDYGTFEEYCQKKLGISRQRADQILRAQDVRVMLEAATEGKPELAKAASELNDRQAIEFTNVNPEDRVELLENAINTPGKLTAEKIRKTKQAKAKIVNAETGSPEQAEFTFSTTITTENSDDADWFKKLTPQERGSIITEARKNKTCTPTTST